jgi:hypothetical protein
VAHQAVLEFKIPIVNIDDLVILILSAFATEIEAAVKRGAPVGDTTSTSVGGTLKQHWVVDWPILDNTIVVSNSAFYAAWVSRGTGLYGPYKTRICARGFREHNPDLPQALAFERGGQLMIRRCVKGQKPNPYVEVGIETGCINAINLLKRVIEA